MLWENEDDFDIAPEGVDGHFTVLIGVGDVMRINCFSLFDEQVKHSEGNVL
jgi:hypothetical protein